MTVSRRKRKAIALLCAYLLLKRRRRQRSCWRRPWIAQHDEQGAYCNLIAELNFDGESFRNYLRMNKMQFNDLTTKVAPFIERQNTHYRASISPGERLAITLRYLATGESFRSLAYQYRVGQSTISEIVPETCGAIYEALKEDYFKFPQSQSDWIAIAEEFQTKWNFPHCLGAIDGKHITVQAPSNSGSTFFNYKHTFSIVLMAVADASYKFTYVDVGCNGRISDGGVFKACSLNESLLRKTTNWPGQAGLPGTNDSCTYHLVADDAFPLRDDIMKPFPLRKCTYTQRVFNYRLSRARRVVENSFGILVSRFRVFSTKIAVDIAHVDKVVLAACALHNYLLTDNYAQYVSPGLLDHEDTENHEMHVGSWHDRQLQSTGVPHNNNPPVTAKLKRELLANYFCSPTGEVAWQGDMI